MWISHVREIPFAPLKCSQTPAVPPHLASDGALVRSPGTRTPKTPRDFYEVFVAQSHSLSTRCLRFTWGSPLAVQDSLSAGG